MPAESGLKIHVSGIVQGVGFRPFIYSLAKSLHLKGAVFNTSTGVEIEVIGSDSHLFKFLEKIRSDAPPLARIDDLISVYTNGLYFDEFSILPSQTLDGEFVPISPDVSICADCEKELYTPSDRRFRYPFINCTNCGPRFSIIKDIPYDRPKTTMQSFPLCSDCLSEYENPLDRRFHAQPVACPVCGPRVKYAEKGAPTVFDEDAIQSARNALMDGNILALKGLGGYHLVCDANNLQAVQNLRDRKKRSDKPFALMSFNLEKINKYCLVSPFERDLLSSPQHPIVILKKKSEVLTPDAIAPNQKHLGFMLPYTPLHLLLLEPEEGFPDIFIMTSGNMSEEPVAYIDSDAEHQLASIADAFLTHNRPIHIRVDDSVMRELNNRVYPIRRARGYVPDAIRVHKNLPLILACGAELKNTFAISKPKYVFISHHIGDLENYESLKSFEEGIEHYKQLFRFSPKLVAADLHPDYLSTKYALSEAVSKNIPLVQVQHHHAHLAACLADNHWESPDPVIGLIFDGTGYGTDSAIWGGEILVGNYASYVRQFHLNETFLPGGDVSIRNPARIALSQLSSAGIAWDEDLPPVKHLCAGDRTMLRSQLQHRINTPVTTSMGRLFDAVSSLIGVRHQATYEGQAAIELENICDPDETGFYEISFSEDQINSIEFFSQILCDFRSGVRLSKISARFHNSIAKICLSSCQIIREHSGISTVAFSGGVWQNMTLLKKTLSVLKSDGFETLIHNQVPTNDGGIALGQIMVASTTTEKD